MSTSLQRFAGSYSATAFSQTPSQTPGLDTLAEGSQYALEQLQLSREAAADPKRRRPPPQQKQLDPLDLDSQSDENRLAFKPAASSQRDLLVDSRSGIRKNSTSVRRRISRACDQCNQLRTKCDGQNPCAHCIEFGLACEYARERKKRGKASKKDLAAAAAAAAASSTLEHSLRQDAVSSPPLPSAQSPDRTVPHELNGRYDPTPFDSSHLRSLQILHSSTANPRSPPSLLPTHGFGSGYHDASYPLMTPHDTHPASIGQFRIIGSSTEQHSSSAPFLGLSPPPPPHPPPAAASAVGPPQSPAWLPLPSPSPANFPASFSMPSFPSASLSLRYPVLQPVLPHIVSILPQSLACDLLDGYFTSSSSSHLSPLSPYVVGYVFRKQSFLHPTKPRVCSPALLASMLWVAAQTSDAAFLTSPPSARGRVCQKLLEVTVSLLRPLIHGPAPGETSPNYAANMVINGVALGGFGVSMDQLGAQSSAAAAVDDISTYVHLATVVSASEYKAASLRWWAAAWSLARELKLGRELPPNRPQLSRADTDRDLVGDPEGEPSQRHHHQNYHHQHHHHPSHHGGGSSGVHFTEEEREERRRIWWLLYTMDRHLALCYNRPLTLLDQECEGLLQPLNDDLWQAGDFPSSSASSSSSPSSIAAAAAAAVHNGYRRTGPTYECTGHSVFGYFLPLMTILGGIVDLQHARNHPRFGASFIHNRGEWNSHAVEITRQLDVYAQSLKDFESRYTAAAAAAAVAAAASSDSDVAMDNTTIDHVSPPSGRSTSTTGSRVSEAIVHTRMVVAYGTHIMHVLHILLAGKWDPISLLDDTDLWISSDSFITAMGHAVSAAEAAADILEYDPDLSFMPFFFGIYLLQGSFLLLLTADKLQGDASPSVVRACETVVRAHEACVVTLNTEYQRNFRKVMRSALAQVRGRIPEDFGEQQQRRREVLALYRWTGDGSGLAL
ncbi:hypothetical protein ASPZODRAFT_148477 [Penicilliopsis zonata CBS 506.65]|uniref:Xylanolytic transcriptional activator xlnR n=1 Tax=Penicilliopsis zonata CBS 506.65 TaxID=1073090 RepID=A0A1L9SVC6_9EURO|nr:hypothetical protein ASPZODRAFT_148477 [Penicilliopsis zonata CBS 506.65]OJJ51138.1 hypothetical protein ASPZODRAFT_148477 [Penicilliopsis zonata CBS 506.65]